MYVCVCVYVCVRAASVRASEAFPTSVRQPGRGRSYNALGCIRSSQSAVQAVTQRQPQAGAHTPEKREGRHSTCVCHSWIACTRWHSRADFPAAARAPRGPRVASRRVASPRRARSQGGRSHAHGCFCCAPGPLTWPVVSAELVELCTRVGNLDGGRARERARLASAASRACVCAGGWGPACAHVSVPAPAPAVYRHRLQSSLGAWAAPAASWSSATDPLAGRGARLGSAALRSVRAASRRTRPTVLYFSRAQTRCRPGCAAPRCAAPPTHPPPAREHTRCAALRCAALRCAALRCAPACARRRGLWQRHPRGARAARGGAPRAPPPPPRRSSSSSAHHQRSSAGRARHSAQRRRSARAAGVDVFPEEWRFDTGMEKGSAYRERDRI